MSALADQLFLQALFPSLRHDSINGILHTTANIQQATHQCFDVSFPQIQSAPWLREYREAPNGADALEDAVDNLCRVMVDQPVPDTYHAPEYLSAVTPVLLPSEKAPVSGTFVLAGLHWMDPSNKLFEPSAGYSNRLLRSNRRVELLEPYRDVFREKEGLVLVRELKLNHREIFANDSKIVLARFCLLLGSALSGKELSSGLSGIPVAVPALGSYTITTGPICCRKFEANSSESTLHLLYGKTGASPTIAASHSPDDANEEDGTSDRIYLKLKKIGIDLEPISFSYVRHQKKKASGSGKPAKGVLKVSVAKAKMSCSARCTMFPSGLGVVTVHDDCRCEIQESLCDVTCSDHQALLKAVALLGGRIIRAAIGQSVENALKGSHGF